MVGNLSLINSFTHSWTIENFMSFCEKEDPVVTITSSSFVLNPDFSIYFRLKIYNDILDNELEKGGIAIFPHFKKKGDVIVTIEYEFCLLDSDSKKNFYSKDRFSYHTFSSAAASQYLLSGRWLTIKDDIMNPKTKLLTEDKLTVLIKMNIVDSKLNEPPLPFLKFPEAQQLFDNKEFTDSILNINGEELKVHKAILAVKSPVFYAMFSKNLSEANENLVKISDISLDVMTDVIKFIYTGTIENFEDRISEILIAADKYCIEDLKIFCCRYLQQKLNFENAVETLILTTTYNLTYLHSSVETFIKNNLRDVLKTKGFKQAKKTHANLLLELLCESMSD